MTDELKPLLSCPFCGGKSKLIESHRFGPEDTTPHYWKVSCNNIGCNGAAIKLWFPSPESAIAAWNRRAESDELRERLKTEILSMQCWAMKSPAYGEGFADALDRVLSLLRREDAE